MWTDILSITFAAVTMNHLGLVRAIGRFLKAAEMPVISCPKCLTFWSTLAYLTATLGIAGLPRALALSLLASYSALWLELLEGYIDTLYTKIYDTVFPAADGTDADA